MRLVAFLLRASWGMVALAIFAGFLSGVSNAGLIALINTTLNSPHPSVLLLISGFAGLAFVTFISTFASRVLLARLSQGAVLELRLRLGRQVLTTPLRHLEEIGSHRLLASMTDDVSIIAESLRFIPIICINGLTIAICLLYLGWLSWIVLLALLLFIVIGVVIYQMLAGSGLRAFRKARDDGDAMFRHFRSLTDGIKELKIHRQRSDAFLMDLLQPTSRSFRNHMVAGITRFTTAEVWGQLMFFAFIALLLFALPQVLPISMAAMTGSTLVVLYTMSPIQSIMGGLPLIGRANIAMHKIEELGASLLAQADAPDATATIAAWACLELVGVTHSYHHEREDSTFTLGPLSTSFRPGELVFLVGGNGSGKTTLAKLLVGLYAPESGEIRLDGRPITDALRDAYRQHFSVVFSDFFLFENLLGLLRTELDARAHTLLTQLQIDHKVQVKDGVLSTINLSQGQRKRLALLTAYLEDRSFYVFDEWASDQDPLFKEVFYTQLLPELKQRGKTILVITHDDKYFHLADRLIKLDYGQIDQDYWLVGQRDDATVHTPHAPHPLPAS